MGIVLTVCEGGGDGAAEADAEGVSSRMGTAWRELRLARSGLLDALGERVMGGGGEESNEQPALGRRGVGLTGLGWQPIGFQNARTMSALDPARASSLAFTVNSRQPPARLGTATSQKHLA